MKNTFWLRILWFGIGILFYIVGINCFLNPNMTLLSIAVLLGISMIVSGLIHFFIYCKWRKYIQSAGWILGDAVLALLFGIIILTNQYLTASLVPYMFSMWLMFSSLLKVVHAFDLKDLGFSNWKTDLLFGILGLVLGFLTAFKPIVGAITISIMIGILLLYRGIMMFIDGFTIRKFIKSIQK